MGVIADLEDAMPEIMKVHEPEPERVRIYQRAKARQSELYAKLLGRG
jgi:sugar (pentulose or hexulose) kinase